jgi:hypothetical protein
VEARPKRASWAPRSRTFRRERGLPSRLTAGDYEPPPISQGPPAFFLLVWTLGVRVCGAAVARAVRE